MINLVHLPVWYSPKTSRTIWSFLYVLAHHSTDKWWYALTYIYKRALSPVGYDNVWQTNKLRYGSNSAGLQALIAHTKTHIATHARTLQTSTGMAMPGHAGEGEQGEIRGTLKLFKMPTSSGARGVNTTQMSAGDPTSQTKLAATCTNTPLCLPCIVCASLKTYILNSDTSGWIAMLVRAEPALFMHLLQGLALLSLKQTWSKVSVVFSPQNRNSSIFAGGDKQNKRQSHKQSGHNPYLLFAFAFGHMPWAICQKGKHYDK